MARFTIDYHDEESGEIEVHDNAIDCKWFGRVRMKDGQQKVDRTAWRDDHDSTPSIDLIGDLGDFVRKSLSLKELL